MNIFPFLIPFIRTLSCLNDTLPVLRAFFWVKADPQGVALEGTEQQAGVSRG